MRSLVNALLIVALLGSSVPAQQPKPNCSEAELRASMAESREAALRVQLETSGARQSQLKREVDQQKANRSETEGRLGEVESKVASLTVANENAQKKVADLEAKLIEREQVITDLILQRDSLLLKIKRANGRWLCEIFRVGCVRER